MTNNFIDIGYQHQLVKSFFKHQSSSFLKKDSLQSFLYFILNIIGIYCCFLIWGLVQEHLVTQGFKFYYFLSFMQSICCVLASILYLFFKKKTILPLTPRNGKHFYFFSGIYSAGARVIAAPLGFHAVHYLSFPGVVLTKCCKPLFILIFNIIWFRIHFTLYRIFAVLLMVIGVSMFFLLQPDAGGSNHATTTLYGIILISGDILLMAYAHSSQDYLFISAKLNSAQMMLYMNGFGAIALGFWMLISPSPSHSFVLALKVCLSNPDILRDVCLFAITGAIGQIFIFHVAHHHGALTVSLICLMRKLGSIVLSTLFFGHSLVKSQQIAVVIVFTGLIIDLLANKKKKTKHDEKDE